MLAVPKREDVACVLGGSATLPQSLSCPDTPGSTEPSRRRSLSLRSCSGFAPRCPSRDSRKQRSQSSTSENVKDCSQAVSASKKDVLVLLVDRDGSTMFLAV